LKVSVIIPTFNRRTILSRAINSVLAQTFIDFEVIICDDASSDGTSDLVNTYIKENSQIRLLTLPFNQGAGAARNSGMLAAQGEYIAFLDSDDEWRPEKLDLQVQSMDKEPSDVGVCFCGATIFKDGDTKNPIKFVPAIEWGKDTFRKFVCDKMAFLTPTVMIRKTCLAVSGMMLPEMRRNQDGEFLLRLFSNFRLVVIPEDLAIIHLVTKPGGKVNHYNEVKNAYPHWAQHSKLIRQKVGIIASLKFLSKRRTHLVTSAIRERLWRKASMDFIKRISIIPFF
jgi:glycosyltransferase involved in cell wall biosynthesis